MKSYIYFVSFMSQAAVDGVHVKNCEVSCTNLIKSIDDINRSQDIVSDNLCHGAAVVIINYRLLRIVDCNEQSNEKVDGFDLSDVEKILS